MRDDDELRRIARDYHRQRPHLPKVLVEIDSMGPIPYPEPDSAEVDMATGEVIRFRRAHAGER